MKLEARAIEDHEDFMEESYGRFGFRRYGFTINGHAFWLGGAAYREEKDRTRDLEELQSEIVKRLNVKS